MFERAPHALTVQPVRLQVTPAFKGPPVTTAVKFAEAPGSMVRVDGPAIVMPVGGAVPPPQPVSALRHNARRTAGNMPTAGTE